MNFPGNQEQLAFVGRVTARAIEHLQSTDQRLFATPFTRAMAERLDEDEELAERVDAFVSRFGRLQDTVGDKLIPLYLKGIGEVAGASVDNLARMERLGLMDSADDWMALRALRNRMVHEYMEDLDRLVEALNRGHGLVETLIGDARRILDDIHRRQWIP